MSSEIKTSNTSGQVGQKYEKLSEEKQIGRTNGEGYDYYFSDSDNDGLADVHDAEDLNPDIQDAGQFKESVLDPEMTGQRKPKNKRIPKGKNRKQPTNSKKPEADKKGKEKKKTKDEKSKKKSQLNFDEKKGNGKLSSKTGNAVITMAASSREVLRRRNQYERIEDSDENSAIQAADTGREASVEGLKGASRRLKHGRKNRNDKATASPSDGSAVKGTQKLNFDKSVKDTKSYQKTSTMSKRYQKQKIKRSYSKTVHEGYSKKAEKTIKGIANKVKQAVGAIAKKVGAYVVGIILAMIMLITTVSAFTGLISNAVSVIISTSYQANDYEITDTENIYNRLEADLEYAIENVESDHSGYDEYKYDIDSVGHDPQVLMAYLTAKYGDFSTLFIGIELSRIFDEQYDYSLMSVTETRTRTRTRISTDPITGETTTTEREVEYDWEVLEVSLEISNFEAVLVSDLSTEEEELFVTLMETKGNFTSLSSPLREDWRNSVTSMYGYRLDPFDGHVEFHTGIDIARPVGTVLVAVFDGLVTDAGYGSGYGNYLELTNEQGQSVFYAHCSSVDVSIGDDVLRGEKVGEMGSTGNSTGSHLHFEVKDSDGTRLNPYFYLSDEIAVDPS